MIYCKSMNYGRLGNQLFRFAACYAHAQRNGDQFQADWQAPDFVKLPADYINLPVPHEAVSLEFSEPHFHFSEIPYQKDMSLDGYFQSEKYFAEYSDKIRSFLRVEQPQKNTCAIHVRRGDYLKIPRVLPVCTKEYFSKAMQYCKEHFGISEFSVYSDDFNWCVENFKEKEVVEIISQGAEADFISMQNHPANIISNSSFSWWAAWLDGHDRVIAPKVWFHPSYHAKCFDLVPGRWARL